MISQIMGNISSISLKTIPFIIILLIVTIIFQKKLNPSFFVGIWFLVFIRLIIPFSLPIQLSSLRLENTLSNIFYTQKNPTYTDDVKAVTEIKGDLPISGDHGLNPPKTASVQDSEIVSDVDDYSLITHKIDYGKILWPLLWSIGFLSIVTSTIYNTYSFQKKLKGSRVPVPLERRVIPLFKTSAVNYPIIFGCFSPKIYVLRKLWSSLSEKEKSFVLLHEEGHYHRKDILSGWLCFLVLAVHWFNPMVWLSYIILQNLKEIACDHFVLDKLSGKEGIQYARTLLSLCESGFTRHTNVFTAGIAGKSSLKRRIEMILNKKKKTILWSLITVIVLSAVITLFLTDPFSPTYINGKPLKDIELKIDNIFNSIIKENNPGGTALVAIDGKVIYRKGFGMANIDKSIKNSPETTFRLESITKQFTATAILLLQEQGLLSLDDTLSMYIPDFPKGETVTIYHLLTQTSGIKNYYDERDFFDLVTKPVETTDLINKIKTLGYNFEPGEEFRYNYSGYFILGYIIEKVSGKSYGKYLSEQIFKKINMKNTGVYENGTEMDHEAIGYSYRVEKKFFEALDWDMTNASGAGNLYSNIDDLFLWNEALFNRDVLSEKSLELAFTPAKLNDGSDASESGSKYGLGWFLNTRNDIKEVVHGGGLPGFRARLLRLPEEKVTIVMLFNDDSTITYPDILYLSSLIVPIILEKEN